MGLFKRLYFHQNRSIPEEDFQKINSFKRNSRYIDGVFFVSEDGPYPNAKALWNDDDE